MLRGTEAAVEVVDGKSTLLTQLGDYPDTHTLGDTFYTQTPYLHGPYMAKVPVAPGSPKFKPLTAV